MLTDELPFSSAHIIACDFLDADECAETVRRVNGLRNSWIKRSDQGFFTLGTASYLDGVKSTESYLASAAETNPLLSTGFNDLYNGLLGFLEHVLDESVSYEERLALPGFHIFRYSGKPAECAGLPNANKPELPDSSVAKRAHFDLQFLQAVPDWTPEATLSFTLPLAQPSGGAGLAVWPLRYEKAVRRNVSAQRFAARNSYKRMSYEPGRMIVHDGFLLHAILHGIVSRGGPAQKGQRITLQGHGVRTEGRWTIYW